MEIFGSILSILVSGLSPIFTSSFLNFPLFLQVAREALETILNVQPKDSGGGSGETRESVVYRQADEMLQKLPPDFIPHEVRRLTCYMRLTLRYHVTRLNFYLHVTLKLINQN